MTANLDAVKQQLNEIILGKPDQIDLCLCALLARGHLLIEDLPGMGKTILAHALARAMGLEFSRIQFTSDMLPGDIIGVTIFDSGSQAFRFHRGPLFASVLLADEINRASPKTQSALLEAMEEHTVSVEGTTHELPDPFYVIATQNPLDQAGTFPLPESQLDRFLMRITLGYPDRDAERRLLEGTDRRDALAAIEPVISARQLRELQQQVMAVHTSPALLDYLQDLVETSRNPRFYRTGLSPRAALDLMHAARAWSILHGREYVVPEDVQDVLPAVTGHRLQGILAADGEVSIASDAAQRLLELTPIR